MWFFYRSGPEDTVRNLSSPGLLFVEIIGIKVISELSAACAVAILVVGIAELALFLFAVTPALGRLCAYS